MPGLGEAIVSQLAEVDTRKLWLLKIIQGLLIGLCSKPEAFGAQAPSYPQNTTFVYWRIILEIVENDAKGHQHILADWAFGGYPI